MRSQDAALIDRRCIRDNIRYQRLGKRECHRLRGGDKWCVGSPPPVSQRFGFAGILNSLRKGGTRSSDPKTNRSCSAPDSTLGKGRDNVVGKFCPAYVEGLHACESHVSKHLNQRPESMPDGGTCQRKTKHERAPRRSFMVLALRRVRAFSALENYRHVN